MSQIEIIVPVHDNYTITKRFIEGWQAYFPHRLIFIDDYSLPQTTKLLKDYGSAVIRNSERLGFPYSVNQGIKMSNAEWICIMNNDVIIPLGFAERIDEILTNLPDNTGIFGPMTQMGSGWQVAAFPEEDKDRNIKMEQSRIDNFCHHFWKAYGLFSVQTPRIVGLCMFINRKVLNRVGLFDESFGLGSFEDDDYCWRTIAAGWDVRIFRGLFLYHIGGQTFGYNETVDRKEKYQKLLTENWYRFASKWEIPNGEKIMNLQCQGRLLPPKGKEGLISIPIVEQEKQEVVLQD